VGITPASTTETAAVPGSQILKPVQSSVGQEQEELLEHSCPVDGA
jgi:hypothetical protein